jgi:superfamily II DNA or RNA helicase
MVLLFNMHLPKIIDNNRTLLLDVFKEISPSFNELSIATGYWDIEGMKLVLDSIQKYDKVRILIGREPLLKRDNKQGIEQPEPDYPDQDFFDDLQRINPSPELKKVVIEMKKMIDQGKLEVRVYRRSFLHAKCYIFGNYESPEAVGIIGSSNFTRNGMTSNSELNALESDHRVVMFQPKNADQEIGHLFWFDELWNDEKTEEWTGKFIELVDSSKVGEHIFTPFEMYIHSLYQVYKDDLISDINVTEDSKNLLHAFQVRNAELLLKKLNKNGIAMLADSVGLGKTITGGAVIKKYIEDPKNKKPRIEVVVPASLKSQWISELGTHHNIIAGIDSVHISSMQNANEIEERKKIDTYRPVDLFVIDEAHNLRNESSERYKELLEWIQNNEGCHVLLMTATPINNQLTDFASQINLASGGREDLFYVQIPKIGGRQQTIKEHYDAIRDLTSEIKKELKDGKKIDTDKVKLIMRPILQHFMVRSTRTGIEREFGGVLDKNGDLIKFPKAYSSEERYMFSQGVDDLFVSNSDIPLNEMLQKNIESIIGENKQLTKHPLDLIDQFKNAENSNLSPIHKIFLLTTYLGLPIYRTTIYKNEFYGRTVEQINERLAKEKRNQQEKFEIKQQMTMHNMMRILFLKRAESSVYALKKSLGYYLERLNKFEEILINDNKIVKISKLVDYEDLLDIDSGEEEAEENKNSISIDADIVIYNIDQLRLDIQKDRDILGVVLPILENLINKDAKINHFKQMIERFNREGKKVLVFSYFSDTVEFLEKNLPQVCDFISVQNTGFTTNKNKKEIEQLAGRFSPVAKRYNFSSGESELQFLFSTDVLSEGQNLQDCSVLVNYDLHWNPVRMIQRNGRINRLGGKHESVHIYNLCPANEIEAYLKLEDRLKQKIEMIKHSIGTDQSILGEEENAIEFNEDFSLVDNKKILEITKSIYDTDADIEKIMQTFEEETDILATEDVFISDLRHFDNSATEEDKYRIYQRIPLEKWGILPLKNIKDSNISETLVHSVILIKDQEKVQEMPLFVTISKTGSAIQFVDRLEALNALQAVIDSKNVPINFDDYNKEKIAHTLDDRLIQFAESAIEQPENTLKPSQEIVLDRLYEMNQPTHLIERVLKQHRNRSDRKYIINRLSKLHLDIKENKPLNQKILSEIIEKSSKINTKLDTERNNKPVIAGLPIIYSYHAKP